ncbi:hypothetical protein ACAW74_01905 [Fibrella sp. WM1]|uniref:hypothetical protein n=1 Tax=Fibrella musci TaxID=3242485 RepID=UPI00351FCDFD
MKPYALLLGTLSLSLTAFAPGDCLLTYQTRLDQLLPKATIEKIYGKSLSTAKLEYRKSAKYPKYDSYQYSWPSDRTVTIKVGFGSGSVTAPDQNVIGLSWLDQFEANRYPDPLKRFRQFYRTPTEAEKKQMAELLDKELAKRGHGTGDRKTGAAVGGTLANNTVYEDVAGIGDAAAWQVTDKKLVVLKGRTTFQVHANVSADKSINLSLAKKLAADVLAKCN